MSESPPSEAVNALFDMFGARAPRWLLESVLETCQGDVSEAIEEILKIDLEEVGNNTVTQNQNENKENDSIDCSILIAEQNVVVDTQDENLQTVYADHSSPSTGTIRKTVHTNHPVGQPPSNKILELNEQLKRIVRYHEAGYRTLVVMRGVPGSGKTTLAKQIVDVTVGPSPANYKLHIFSADDYFIRNGAYYYDVSHLHDAHQWNKNQVSKNITEGLSPIVVDNTHIRLWEMEPHIRYAVTNGYYIELVEPNTPWCKKASQLAKKNVHNVPYAKILKQLDNYEPHYSVESLMKMLKIKYVTPFIPPVFRYLPPVRMSLSRTQSTANGPAEQIGLTYGTSDRTAVHNGISTDQLLEQWENGEDWTSEKNKVTPDCETDSVEPKEQRKLFRNYSHSRDNSHERSHMRIHSTSPVPFGDTSSLNLATDWKNIPNIPLPALDRVNCVEDQETPSVTSKKSVGTSVERTDFCVDNSPYITVTAKPRDINVSYVSPQVKQIPKSVMLDKGTITYESFDLGNFNINRCQSEKKHFIEFRRMFDKVPEDLLRDIFEKCHGDVNWASEGLLDGNPPSAVLSPNLTQNSQSIPEDEDHTCNEMCGCTSKYDITPCITPNEPVKVEAVPLEIPSMKKKKEKFISESSFELVRQIKESVEIPDCFYSNHCLKIKKFRHGIEERPTPIQNLEENASFISTITAATPLTEAVPNSYTTETLGLSSKMERPAETSKGSPDLEIPEAPEVSPGTSQQENPSDPNDTVDVYVGPEFIRQVIRAVEERDDEISYEPHILPVINMPRALLTQVYAMWIESLAHQTDTHSMYRDVQAREDEQYARQLAAAEDSDTEFEIVPIPTTPATQPTLTKTNEPEGLREIMDLEVALSAVARATQAAWRRAQPDHLAARLSRDKLATLFPHIGRDTLCEVLVAHGNCFNSTVEALLMSTGDHSELLGDSNSVAKFIAQREAELEQQQQLEQEAAEDGWPVLGSAEKAMETRMETVEEYREKAKKHLDMRVKNKLKAESYLASGKGNVAAHYVELANYHQRQFEQNNSRAATALVQVHAANKSNTTLDLHYMFVTEAMETLDLFLDHHISRLRESGRGGHNSLFLITGRGLHSPRGPRIKPAVKRRLAKRGITVGELNPGLLTVCVTPSHKLTDQCR